MRTNSKMLVAFLATTMIPTVMGLAQVIAPTSRLIQKHSSPQILLWGIPEKTCISYGGKYDVTSGLSQWGPKLTLDVKSPDDVSGTLTLGNKALNFVSRRKAIEPQKSAIERVSIELSDDAFSITASRTNHNELEITVRASKKETVYSYDFMANKSEPKSKDRTALSSEELISAAGMFMIPLLSYKLGEAGLTGNVYPAALPIHLLAITIAGKMDIDFLTIKDKKLVPLRISRPTSDCTGRMPGTPAQECWGQCGPATVGDCTCWEIACGDCCCHQACLVHDLNCKCNNWIACFPFAFTALLCGGPCNNPGAMPTCESESGSGPGSNNGPGSGGPGPGRNCESGDHYCERLKRCVRKTQCTGSCVPACRNHEVCYQGECIELEI